MPLGAQASCLQSLPLPLVSKDHSLVLQSVAFSLLQPTIGQGELARNLGRLALEIAMQTKQGMGAPAGGGGAKQVISSLGTHA